MTKYFPFDFIQIDSKPNIHLFKNGSRGSCCGNIDLKDFLGGPSLKKIKTEFTFSEAKHYAAILKDSEEYGQSGVEVCSICLEELEKEDQEYRLICLQK